MRIIHLADVHWRGLSRHEEYRESFSKFFKIARELNPDVIYVGGDIVHSKTQGISPELIDSLSWWFSSMAEICPVHAILGNHDGLIHNKGRQDAITPILSALDNSNIHLYKDSGTYSTGIPGFNWCVFSCFDELGWENVKPVDGEINLALFHGGVLGSKTDINWDIEGEVTVDFFDKYEFSLLGDIHKLQFLDGKKTIAYPGSTIQQNYGEDPGKGFLFWEIEDKDNFTSTFYEIPHDRPFITIDWQGDLSKTLESAKKHSNKTRFRIRSQNPISQEDIRALQRDLKSLKDATEVVFKCESSFDSSRIKLKKGEIKKRDLRDSSTQKRLIREYYLSNEISDGMLSEFDSLIARYLSQIAETDSVVRNIRWNINKLKFDNTFAYGNSNIINFDHLPGITGIFGKNARGKSAIVGSLMYGLFNTTDRGSIKNIHIINNRKDSCCVETEVTVNGDRHKVERKTIKHQTRKGDVYASTAMSFLRLGAEGEADKDLSDEQRRKTEKILKRSIGSSEDFLMTSLASQGQMNTFIKERATSRKMILSKFLDLEVFDKMHEKAREDSSELRSQIRNVPDIDWDAKIDDLKFKLINKKKDIETTNERLSLIREKLQQIKIELAVSDNPNIVTTSEIERQLISIESLKVSIDSLLEEKELLLKDINEKNGLILKIRLAKSDFSIEDFKKKLEFHRELEKKVLSISYEYEKEKVTLDDQKKSIKILSEVPCGDQFPSCKFIKNSHKNKSLIEDQIKKVKSLGSDLRKNRRFLKDMNLDEIEKSISKFESLEKKQVESSLQISRLRVLLGNKENEIESLNNALITSSERLEDMKARVVDDDSRDISSKLKSRIVTLELQIEKLDKNRTSQIDKITRIKVEISRITGQRSEYEKIKNQLRIYDMFIQAVSKKGIPLQIMMSQLPVINSEIEKILQGVVGFTVSLEADDESNSMDVYIDYGDSKRIIELASGMEKMMASLAIRVALINVSTLPKTNMLIIDEGFGALDENNIEACGRLLISLKKWFRNILIISHVDAIKDVVDNSLDIIKKEKDSYVCHE